MDEKLNKLCELLQAKGFEGTDASINESITEYGFVYNVKTGEAIYHFPQGLFDRQYDATFISKKDIKEAFGRHAESILKFVGMTEKEFFGYSLQSQIDSIDAYSGAFKERLSFQMDIDDIINHLSK